MWRLRERYCQTLTILIFRLILAILVGGVISNEVVVTDGTLNLEFLHDALEGMENPLINGIEIIQIGDDTLLPPTVSLIGAPTILGEDGGTSQFTFLTSEPVPVDSSVAVSFEIIPNAATPQQDYVTIL